MKIRSVLVASVVMVAGFAGTASAGVSAPAWPGDIDCGYDEKQCVNGFMWEVDYKCEGFWEDAGTRVDVVRIQAAELRAEGGRNGYADCRIDIDLESDDDVHKYEVKCESPEYTEEERGKSGKTKKVHDKVELEIKAVHDESCHSYLPI